MLETSKKKQNIAFLLVGFLSFLGAHRFYVGRIFSGTLILGVGITGLVLWHQLMQLDVNDPNIQITSNHLLMLLGHMICQLILLWEVLLVGCSKLNDVAGLKLKRKSGAYGRKSQATTFILCLFLGLFGFHRFYLGKFITGILMLLTLGGLGIWYIIDIFRVGMGGFKDNRKLFLR